MAEPHTLKSLDAALDGVMNDLTAMGELVCSIVSRAGPAAIDCDATIASEIIQG